jgi:hypothetical protein
LKNILLCRLPFRAIFLSLSLFHFHCQIEFYALQEKTEPSQKNPKLSVSFTRDTCKPGKKFETNTTPESGVLVAQHMNYMTNKPN